MSLLCGEHWPEETESSHQDNAMLRVLHLEEQEFDEIPDGMSVPEENTIIMENFKSYLKIFFCKEVIFLRIQWCVRNSVLQRLLLLMKIMLNLCR